MRTKEKLMGRGASVNQCMGRQYAATGLIALNRVPAPAPILINCLQCGRLNEDRR